MSNGDPPEGYSFQQAIETESSSSNIVVRSNEYGMEVTLDPMEHPIRRLDVYPSEVEEFLGAIRAAAGEVEIDG